MKVLVIQTAFIGDIALSVFLTNEIKTIIPDANITFITTKIGHDVIKSFNFVDNIVILDKRAKHKSVTSLLKFCRQPSLDVEFDYIFTLHRSFRSAIITKLLKAKNKFGFDKNSLSFLLDKRIHYVQQNHEIIRNRQFLSFFPNFSERFDYKTLVKNNISSFRFNTEDRII